MSNTSASQRPASSGLKKKTEAAEVEVISLMCDPCGNTLAMIRILDQSPDGHLMSFWEIKLPRHGEGTSTLLRRYVACQDTTPKSSGQAPDKEE